MGSRLEQAKKEIHDIYQNNNLSAVFEAMDIIQKYESVEGKSLMEFSLDTLQADSLRLCALNFYLGTLASNLDADANRATNKRRYEEANIFCGEKANDPKATLGSLERIAEVRSLPYRQEEVEAQRKALIMKQAVSSVSEMVNMLKKVVERLCYQGQATNM